MKLSADLPKEIIKDVWFHRWVMLFYVLIIFSLVGSVIITAKTKVEITKLRQIEMQADYLENEWRNLILEEETLSEHSKVKDVAEHELNMINPDATNQNYIEIE